MNTKYYDPEKPKFDIPTTPFEDTHYVPRDYSEHHMLPEETPEPLEEISDEDFYKLAERSYAPDYDFQDDEDELEANANNIMIMGIVFALIAVIVTFIVSAFVYGIYKLFTL